LSLTTLLLTAALSLTALLLRIELLCAGFGLFG
jgi:hypothetical protein